MSECRHGTPLYAHCPDCHPPLVCPPEPALSEDKPASPEAATRRAALEKHLADEIARMRGDDAEITRLRADLAAAQEERDKLAKEVARLREAMSRESDGAQYLASLLVEAEAALLSVSQQRGKAESERNAAQEREQRMREALTTARGFYQVTHIHAAIDAALSAIRGEP